MNRFTLFSIRLVACIACIVATGAVCIFRLATGGHDVGKLALTGLMLAWVIGPSSEDMRAFIGLMTCED